MSGSGGSFGPSKEVKMKAKILVGFVCSAVVLLTQTGCILCGLAAASAAGGGVVAYKKGDLEILEPVGYDEAFNAVDATVQDMGMALQKREKKPLVGLVTAKSHYGKVTYSLENMGDKLTSISIRVGTFGDPAVQRQIYAKLKTNYGVGPRVDPDTGLPK
ncbi:MAG: hypothetical protein CMO74_05175 [Verrucomicrobiales bacterium]|nr:hypothetical protein [Verrucomicrobiales bacterium]